jgi:hypothetical protein
MNRRDLPLGLVPLLTLVASGLGFSCGLPFLFPALTMAAGYPLLVILLLSGHRRRALAAMFLWAGTAAVAAVALCVFFPERASEVVWNGPAYTKEMFDWIATGEGPESDPRRFLPQHLFDTTAFVVLSLATASLTSIFFGTVLLHKMAYYVAQVVRAADGAPLALAIGWHPWSILRVGCFVALGVILAEPLLGRLTGKGRRMEGGARWVVAAAAGLAADAALKAWLAPVWRLWLLELTAGAGH